jgi:hypothetical protein
LLRGWKEEQLRGGCQTTIFPRRYVLSVAGATAMTALPFGVPDTGAMESSDLTVTDRPKLM